MTRSKMIERAYRWFVAALAAIISACLIWGGAILISYGGSPYYLIAGLFLLPATWLTIRRSRLVMPCLLGFIVATAVWALWEEGGAGWGLLPRLSLPFALIVLLSLPPAITHSIRHRRAFGAAVVGGVLVLVLILSGKTSTTHAPEEARLPAANVGDWRSVGEDPGGGKFSQATQITPGNVSTLKIAWTYEFKENRHIGKGGLQATPIQHGNVLYLCSGQNDIVALDVDTGAEIWKFRAHSDIKGVMSAGCRGVAYYSVPGATGDCSQRIITSTVDARLLAVDAENGQPCEDFGDHGSISLLKGMGVTSPGYYFTTSAPTVAQGRIIVGGWVTDSQYWGEPAGAIRAFDAKTGEFAWAFDPGNPEDHTEPVDGKTFTLSTPNAWGPMSVDEELGLVYAPVGNPTPDFFGRQRRPFDDSLGSSVIALDVRTGDMRWAFQTVHHDLWDYDVAAQPLLLDLKIAGKPRHGLVQLTKRGETFLLDRETGQPIAPVNEQPVPVRGGAPEERLSLTQPFSSLPSVRGKDLSEASMWGLTALDQLWCRIEFRKSRYDGIFTPPGTTPSINYPGYLGGTNWGGGTYDRRNSRLIFNLSHVPVRVKLVPRAEANSLGVGRAAPETQPSGSMFAQEGTPYAVQVAPFLSPLGIPCNSPPFGRIVAMDLQKRTLVWDKVLGTTRDSGPFGLASHISLPTGMPNTGGPISTASGLVFIAATQDAEIRAFDSESGTQLWQDRLPAGGQATPMTYISPRTGKQYLVISAGGNRLLGSKLGNFVVAYSLPHR